MFITIVRVSSGIFGVYGLFHGIFTRSLSSLYLCPPILSLETKSSSNQPEGSRGGQMQIQTRRFPTRVFCMLTVVLTAAAGAAQTPQSPTQAPAHVESPVTLVREVVYNELHDHERHGWGRYLIEKHPPEEKFLGAK